MKNLKSNFLDLVAQDLPIIRPIKEFIHLNLLLPYQKMPFWDAIQVISLKLEAFAIPSINYFKNKMNEDPTYHKLILDEIKKSSTPEEQSILHNHIFNESNMFIQHDIRIGKIHNEWNTYLEVDVMRLADSMLIRWLGMFLDQGISEWQMPGSDQLSFYQCIKKLLTESLITPTPFTKKNVHQLFFKTSEEAIAHHLDYLCPDSYSQQDYAREAIFTLRGWAGLIHSITKEPHLLTFPRQITLNDFLAIKLILERAWIEKENKTKGWPHLRSTKKQNTHPLAQTSRLKALKICQEVFEEYQYTPFLKLIQEKTNETQQTQAKFQAVFCMDDRECSLRRHLEEINQEIETFGTAGHFGIECFYQHSRDPLPKKHCPLPVVPKVLIKESNGFNQPKKNSSFSSIYSTYKLMLKLFFPLKDKKEDQVILKKNSSTLQIERIDEDLIQTNNHFVKVGYTYEEMAKIIYEQLHIIGLTQSFAPLIFIMGHGSTSENNPYFTAYGCGACSGRPGGPNAKIIVKMANSLEVRKILKNVYNFTIPNDVYFVAAMHDTCSDIVTFYDSHLIPHDYQDHFKTFQKNINLACMKNSAERCTHFEKFSFSKLIQNKSRAVKLRSLSFFETRPEMGHTDVMMAIVGNRSLTKSLDLKRRAFLQSYSPEIDPEGKILAQILTAVVPVCSGINLDYFFSHVDNLRFGAGSKLPQNVVGNIGTSHGTESDLLYGLPLQMVDQHTPTRLMIVVEQEPNIALSAIKNHALVNEIIHNNWVHYYCYSSKEKKYYQYTDSQMKEKKLGGKL